MKTYTINFTNGRKIRITGEPLDPLLDGGVVTLHNGAEIYSIPRENVLYWSVLEVGDEQPGQQDEDCSVEDLTDRQKRILDGMARGKTNGAIARELGYSESTIRHESMTIYRTLGVSRREEAVVVMEKAAKPARLDSPV